MLLLEHSSNFSRSLFNQYISDDWLWSLEWKVPTLSKEDSTTVCNFVTQ